MISCSTTKKVYICGDRECINKSEAKKYFKENLSLEIKIIDKKKEKTFNLVQLNTSTKKNTEKKKDFFNLKKIIDNKQKAIEVTEPVKSNKKFSLKKKNSDIKNNKNMPKQKTILIEEVKKISPKPTKKNNLIKKNNKVEKIKLVKTKPIESFKPKKQKNSSTETYLCEVIENCDIDKITSYLIKKGKDKKYPNLTNE